MMDHPHLVQGLPISFQYELDEHQSASETEETNSERDEASSAPN
jgi:hypothetical protein